jgi:hypothetical protein
VLDPRLDRGDGMPGVTLLPDPVEVLGDDPELHDEVCREVLQTTLIVQDFLASNHQKLRIVTHCGFPLRSPGKREGQPVRVPFYYRRACGDHRDRNDRCRCHGDHGHRLRPPVALI